MSTPFTPFYPLVVIRVGEEFSDINSPIPIMNDRDQAIFVTFDVENRVRIGEICRGERGSYRVNVRKIRFLKNFSPTYQHRRGIYMTQAIRRECFFLDYIHAVFIYSK